ncbi:MAG: hybrid sensor histidine kinase/response regulator, partial [Anaerolineae bacterium]|nr:hybrid sensor histidine kinase/response regulator [Anaerolineae bacterium]
LYLALHWALDRAMAARRNEEEARAHRGELARTLKALNEAYQRLEYISYDLARAREVAEEARANKQRFVATVSHEMRTPLNVLAALSELMYFSPERYSGARLSPEFRRDAREIYRSSRHLVRLIDDVLDMTRIEAGQMRIEFQPVRLGDIVAEALDMIRPLVRGRAIALEAEVPPDLPPVWVDRARVQQVLLNLLNNAQRFTERGSITVHAAREAEQVRVTVADTGVGIPPEAHEEMFKEFYQVEGLAARGQGGHGLGLAVCKRFVEMHGGRIWVESDGVPGHGTRFSFTLPLAPVQTQTTRLLEGPKPMRTASGRGRVLVVLGADPAAVRLLEQGLQEYQIVQAGTAKETADLVRKVHVQAILINSARGSRSGQHLRELRLELEGAVVPIVLCPLVGLRELRRTLGVVDYLVKPVMPEALWALMDRLGDGVRRVLVVDDDPQMARVISRVLQMSGREYEVLCAYDGEEALGKMRWRRPDMVLLDLVMPVKDGFAVLAEMQRDAALQRIPVAVITAQEPTPEDERRMGGRSLVVHAPGGFSNEEAISYLRAVLSARQAAVG